jgi:F-type H+-transporting ATPase subunit delta
MKSADGASQSEALNVGAQKIARVYAEAYLAAAEKDGQAVEALDELESLVADVFDKDSRFETALSGAALGRHAREELIRKTFEGRASDRFVRFLGVLNDHDRLELIRGIARGARQIQDEKNRRVKVYVTTAVPLPDDQAESLKQVLRDRLHLDPVLETAVDPGLLGGLKVRVGDIQYDSSVRTRIDHIRQSILERGSHEIQVGRDRFSSDV